MSPEEVLDFIHPQQQDLEGHEARQEIAAHIKTCQVHDSNGDLHTACNDGAQPVGML